MTAALDRLPAAYTNLRLLRAEAERDPLSFWRFAVPRIRTALSMFAGTDPIDELALRGPNKGTKSESAAAFVTRCLQKAPELDGCPIPQWRGPVEALCCVLDYKQQLLSVQPAFERVMGHWPCRPRRHGLALETMTVAPMGPDGQPVTGDETEWSKLVMMSQKNDASATGARADVVDFDEPPKLRFLQELRKAGHAGRGSIILIQYTPTIRSQWAPLRDQYGDNPRSSITRVSPYMAECRWSLTEVADWVLSRAEKRKMLDRYELDPIKMARIHGDFSNDSGLCPFFPEVLAQMRKLCRPGEIHKWRVAREATAEGKPANEATLPVEIWHHPKPGRRYWITIDPASGVEDESKNYDPLGLHVTEMGSADLCARFAGYCTPYAMGILAAVLARQYQNAKVQPEINDGWATGVFAGLRDSRYGNIGKEPYEYQPGKWSDEEGFRTTQKTRPGKVAAVQQWIQAFAQGAPYGECLSAEVLDCLADCILDQSGKPVAAPGFHDEDMIIRGHSLLKCVPRGGAQIPDRPVAVTETQRLVAMIHGKDAGEVAPRRASRMLPRRGPKL